MDDIPRLSNFGDDDDESEHSVQSVSMTGTDTPPPLLPPPLFTGPLAPLNAVAVGTLGKRGRGRPRKYSQASDTPPRASVSGNKGRRGRPPKKKRMDEEYVESGTPSLEVSEDEPPEEHLTDDPNYSEDSDGAPRKRSRRTKKKLPTYNEKGMYKEVEKKAIADAQMAKLASPIRKRGRPRKGTNQSTNSNSPAVLVPTRHLPHSHSEADTLRNIIRRCEPPKEHEYLRTSVLHTVIPWPKNAGTLPVAKERMFVSQVEEREAVKSACGGFQRFIRNISDIVLLEMLTTVQKDFDVNGADDLIKLSQVIRVVWNMLPEDVRLSWELLTRQELRQAYRQKVASKKLDELMEVVQQRLPSIEPAPEPAVNGEKMEVDDQSSSIVPQSEGGGEKEKTTVNGKENALPSVSGDHPMGSPTSPTSSGSGRLTPVGDEQTTVDSGTVKKKEEDEEKMEETEETWKVEEVEKKKKEPPRTLTEEEMEGMLRMPHCEQTFIAGCLERIRPDRTCFPCPLCEEGAREEMYTFREVAAHITSSHFCGLHYGCHLCGRVFSTPDALRTHTDCEGFSSYMLNRLLGAGAEPGTLGMKIAHVFLCCAECGLVLPIRPQLDVEGQIIRFKEQWCFLIRTLSHHNCDSLLPIVVYMPEEPEAHGIVDELRFTVTPSMCVRDIPLGCESCSIDLFSSPDEAEKHYLDVHNEDKHKCIECGMEFGTRPYFMAHCLSHLPPSVVFGDYLSTTCRFFPPPGDECHAPRLGYNHNEKTVYPIGGHAKITQGFVADYVHPFESTLYSKLMNAESFKKAERKRKQEKKKSEEDGDWQEEESTDDEIEKIPPDLGYEHVGRLWLDEPHEERSNRHRVAQYFEENEEAKEFLLAPETRLFNDRETVEQLGIEAGEEAHQGKVTFDLCFECPLTNAWLSKMQREYTIPLGKPLEKYDTSMVADYLLLDERVYYCHCGVVAKGTPAGDHVRDCFLAELGGTVDLEMSEKISLIYSPFWPSDSRLHCRLCPSSACGIASFRVHLLKEHCIFAPFVKPQEANVSMSERSKSLIYRTMSAQLADSQIGVGEDGLLKRIRPPVPVIPSRAGGNLHYRTNMPMNNLIRKQAPEILPYRTSRAGNGRTIYECTVCSFVTQQYVPLSAHMFSAHSWICNKCAGVFCKKVNLESHLMMGCQSIRGSSDDVRSIRARCPMCSMVDNLRVIVQHLMTTHYSAIRYDKFDGRVRPMIKPYPNGLPPPPAQSVMRRQVVNEVIDLDDDDAPPSLVATTGTVYAEEKTKFECALCGMYFKNGNQLRRHYGKHQEQWSTCPLCSAMGQDVHIVDIPDMIKHIQKSHVSSYGKRCNCCARCFTIRPYIHLIYDCNEAKVCMLCPDDGTVYEKSDDLNMHRGRVHGANGDKLLHRFECSNCHVKFHHRGQFEDHQCLISFMPHKCNCGSSKVFHTRSEFMRHFNVTHLTTALHCRLCDKSYPTTKLIQQHRSTHMIVLRDNSGRRLILLNEDLEVEEETVEEFAKRIEAEAEAKREKEEKILHEDVRVLVKDTIRDVVNEMGEEWMDDCDNLRSPEEMKKEEEEDDCVMLDDEAMPSLRPVLHQPTSSGSHSPSSSSRPGSSFQLPREEQSEVINTGQSQYFEDEEINELGTEGDLSVVQPQSSSLTVREVIDENADDDLAVVAEVAHPSGTLPSVIASATNRKKIKCTKCSSQFVTQSALQYHLETTHRFDAGGTCDEDLGIPIDDVVYICRTCCVAFEMKAQYERHIKDHNSTTQYSCDQCSMVSYNHQLVNLHLRAHVEGKLSYSCHHCMVCYEEDAQLYGHLADEHNVRLLFFCKLCHVGSTNGRYIAEHMMMQSCVALRMEMKKGTGNVEPQFGCVPANLVHFNPVSVEAYRKAQKLKQMVEPSLCTHRTFVAPSSSMVACLECKCLMNSARFLAMEAAKSGGVEPPAVYLRSGAIVDTPQRKLLCEYSQRRPRHALGNMYRNSLNSVPTSSAGATGGTQLEMMINGRSMNGTSTNGRPAVQVRRPYQQRIQRPFAGRDSPQAGPSATVQLTTGRPINPLLPSSLSTSVSMTSPTGTLSAPTQGAYMSNGRALGGGGAISRALVNKPSTSTAAARPTPQQRKQATPPKVVPPKPQPSSAPQVVINLSDEGEDDDIIFDDTTPAQPVARTAPRPNRIGGNCTTCNKVIPNEQVLLLHDLHTNGHNFFCLDCPKSMLDEQAAVEHFFTVHVARAMQQRRNDQPPFRAMVIDVQCPFNTCGYRGDNLNALRTHLATHALPYQGSFCAMRFCSTEKCDEHSHKHREMEEGGAPDSNCCVLCGTLDLWQKRIPEVNHVLSHTAIHGLKKFFMCRDCSVCFRHDADGRKFARHFESDHVKVTPGTPNGYECKLCKIQFTKAEMLKHAKEKHYVYGLKKRTTASEGQLVVKSGADMRMLLGMERIYYPDDLSDID